MFRGGQRDLSFHWGFPSQSMGHFPRVSPKGALGLFCSCALSRALYPEPGYKRVERHGGGTAEAAQPRGCSLQTAASPGPWLPRAT